MVIPKGKKLTLPALTLRHPWPFAVARLDKDIENRTWKPPRTLIGRRFAIHGGAVPKGEARDECEDDVGYILHVLLTADLTAGLSEARQNWLYTQGHGANLKEWITPGIVAVATLADVVTKSDSPWFSGPYGWVLSDIRVLDTPIPHRGAQGIWQVEPDALRLIQERMPT